MDTVSLFDAKNRLSASIDRIEDGREVSTTRHGKPVARFVPIAPQAGQGRSAVQKLRTPRQSIAGRGEVFTRADLTEYRDEGRR